MRLSSFPLLCLLLLGSGWLPVACAQSALPDAPQSNTPPSAAHQTGPQPQGRHRVLWVIPIGSSIRFSLMDCFFAVQEGEFAAETVASYLSGGGQTAGNPFGDYEKLCDQGNDVVQDFIDCLWEYPLAFQRMMGSKHREAIIDIFAGRLYGEIGDSNPARIAMRKLLASKHEISQQAKTDRSVEPAVLSAA